MKLRHVLVGFIMVTIAITTVFAYLTFQRRSTPIEHTPLSELKELLSSSSGPPYFLYPEGMELSDYLSAKEISRTFEDFLHIRAFEYNYQVGDEYIDSRGLPKLEAIHQGNLVVLVGGPSTQAAVKYYEDTKETLVVSKENATHFWLETREGVVIPETLHTFENLDAHHDVFLVEFFKDKCDRYILILYGYGWRGTMLATLHFNRVIFPQISDYDESYYIYNWVDSSDINQTLTDEAEGGQKYSVIQASVVSFANETIIRSFADAVHSRGLRMTWYVSKLNMEQTIFSLIKSYASYGDKIELSFGNIFFNELEPEKRLYYVDESMEAFKKAFGDYPSMVQSYYIDAYTLSYISLWYPSVKGAITFVNHEVFGDQFKSAGAYYMPYYPSRYNTLVPGEGRDKINIVAFPFFQRDITNSILNRRIVYNLSPQDGLMIVKDWRPYFRRLFAAFINGWDQFGLAIYLIDLTWPFIPLEVIEEDLAQIQFEIESGNCTNVLDTNFVKWFRSEFEDSPNYRWAYEDPEQESFSSEWYFSPAVRIGYLNEFMFEMVVYPSKTYEAGYARKISPYDNSLFMLFGDKERFE
ncbi:MAG: hypothetical protein OEX01_04060 [Candidatus Bathyarchaeota archaeon]|nr:hypothetical protein [Candidatus Bathyarchaeota archaeon]